MANKTGPRCNRGSCAKVGGKVLPARYVQSHAAWHARGETTRGSRNARIARASARTTLERIWAGTGAGEGYYYPPEYEPVAAETSRGRRILDLIRRTFVGRTRG